MIEIDNKLKPLSGKLVYIRSDYAFDTLNHEGALSQVSLSINSTQITVDESGRLLFVWGYTPHTAWKTASLRIPEYEAAALFYRGTAKTVPGIGIRITNEDPSNNEFLPTFYDKSINTVCIGDFNAVGKAIMFAPGAIAVLNQKEFLSLWLTFKMV